MADSNNNSSKLGFKLRSLSFKKSKQGIQRKRPSSVSGNLNSSRLSVSSTVVCEAISDFHAILPCDLSFSVGDRITVITKTAKQFDWWEGKLKDVQNLLG